MQTVYKNKVTDLANEAIRGNISPDVFYQGLTQTISALLGCSRTSLWRYTSANCESVVCLNLYETANSTHSHGQTLHERDFAPYFQAMHEESLIVASHARLHPATSCFNELYFAPNDIHSLLDVGINVLGEPYGLFCCEQVGGIREWSDDDVNVLRLVGTLCSMAFKKLGLTAPDA